MKKILLLILITLTGLLCAQDPVKYLKKLKKAESDTARLNCLNEIAGFYLTDNKDSALKYCDLAFKLASEKKIERYNYKGYYNLCVIKRVERKFKEAKEAIIKAKELAKGNQEYEDEATIEDGIVTGILSDIDGDREKTLKSYLTVFDLSKKINNKRKMLLTGGALGLYYKKNNEPTAALGYLLDAFKIARELNDSNIVFTMCINLGSLYEKTKDNEKALDFYRIALVNSNDESGHAIAYFKISKVFGSIGKQDSSKYYIIKTTELHLKRKDEVGLIFDYSTLAGIYEKEGKDALSKEYWDKAQELALKYKDSVRITSVYASLATSYKNKKQYNEALRYYNLSQKYFGSSMIKETAAMIYKNTSEVYKELGKYKEAYDFFVLYKALSDSVNNVKETRKQTELRMGFEFEQIESKLKGEAAAKELLSKAEHEKERQRRNYLLIGLFLISVFLVLAVRSYIQKRKANFILEKQKLQIEKQKKIVELKNIEISDSINYALRIQTASLPEPLELGGYFKKYGLFFRPKDVVSGDFYWAAGSEDRALIAIADCTGHGVPGAITSMIGSMLLNEIYYVKKMHKPDEVLKELNRLVKVTLRQGERSTSRDGMDIAFCEWNKTTNELLYAGANRPLYLVRPGKETEEFKPTKLSIGGFVTVDEKYQLNKIQLQAGDTIVLTSDGYADQFGGDKEKKFTTRAFKELLQNIASMDPVAQRDAIEKRFDEWKGIYNQTDDVLVFILKI